MRRGVQKRPRSINTKIKADVQGSIFLHYIFKMFTFNRSFPVRSIIFGNDLLHLSLHAGHMHL